MASKHIFGLVLFSFISIYSSVSAQINIKVGYAGAWNQKSQVNSIIRDFNLNYGSTLEDKMDEFTSNHGLTVGLRYRWNRLGIEASWQSLSSRSDFIGDINYQGNVFKTVKDKWFMSEVEYSLGIENYIGNFGYGASIGSSTLRIKTDILGSTRKKREVTNSSAPMGKLYLIFQYPSSNVGVALKPYIQFPLGDYDVSSFQNDLYRTYNPTFQASVPTIARYTNIGLSIVLYNGKQVR